MDLEAFFREQGINVFSQVRISDLPKTDQVTIVHMLPGALSVIVFGKEVPAAVYQMPAKEKTREMLRIAESLDRSAIRLAQQLNTDHRPARSVPLYLPVTIQDGKVRGIVRLKHVAAAGKLGSLGKSSILISPRYGNRLLFSGVVTSLPVSETEAYREPGRENGPQDSNLCAGCGRCIQVCPGGALGPDGVDAFRCRTIRAWIPPSLVPVVTWLLGRQLVVRTAAPIAPFIAHRATIPCSLCVTECPRFMGTDGA